MATEGTGVLVPRLSVTVLNYNYARFLPGCLDSILSQTFRDFEVIVIDDCSTDDSIEVLQPYLGGERVRLVRHETNQGYVRSLIEGSEEHSRGEYMTVISADDLVAREDAFERQVQAMDARPEATFCFSAFDRIFEDPGQHTSRHDSYEADQVISGEQMLRAVLMDNNVQVLHSGAIIRRAAYDRAGRYLPHLYYAVDMSMWLRLSLEGPAAYIAEALYGYRIHAAQMSGTGGHRNVMLETFENIDAACAEARRRGMKIGSLRRDATRAYLFGGAMDEAFRGERRAALTRCRIGLQLRPRDCLMSKLFWIVVLRAVLGERVFSMLRSARRARTASAR